MIERERERDNQTPILRRRKECKFCADKVPAVDYKDDKRLRRFMTERGKIMPRRITGTCARHHRQLTRAVRRARILALMPFISDHYR